jgi:hypothetical protein
LQANFLAQDSGSVEKENKSKTSFRRVLLAAIVTYLAFGLMVVATERVLSSVAPSGRAGELFYFVADLISQCLYLVGAGRLCRVIARSSHWSPIAILIALGLFVGSISLVTSWNSEPHWYGIALLTTYAPCVWIGWVFNPGADDAQTCM